MTGHEALEKMGLAENNKEGKQFDDSNIQKFAELLEKQQIEQSRKSGWNCPANIANCKVKIVKGNKYTKVNVGNSGKYMVDKEGNIYGIKAYGVIHRGQYYGTLSTIDQYYWGHYRAYRVAR